MIIMVILFSHPSVTGSASLRIDAIMGKGAFATVYQATDPVTSSKVVLKVRDNLDWRGRGRM